MKVSSHTQVNKFTAFKVAIFGGFMQSNVPHFNKKKIMFPVFFTKLDPINLNRKYYSLLKKNEKLEHNNMVSK